MRFRTTDQERDWFQAKSLEWERLPCLKPFGAAEKTIDDQGEMDEKTRFRCRSCRARFYLRDESTMMAAEWGLHIREKKGRWERSVSSELCGTPRQNRTGMWIRHGKWTFPVCRLRSAPLSADFWQRLSAQRRRLPGNNNPIARAPSDTSPFWIGFWHFWYLFFFLNTTFDPLMESKFWAAPRRPDEWWDGWQLSSVSSFFYFCVHTTLPCFLRLEGNVKVINYAMIRTIHGSMSIPPRTVGLVSDCIWIWPQVIADRPSIKFWYRAIRTRVEAPGASLVSVGR